MAKLIGGSIDGRLMSLSVGDRKMTCEIASSLGSRITGLSDHAELPHDGMIFIYETSESTSPYSREDMSFQISIWFFDSNGELISSGWNLNSDDKNIASCDEPYRYVIETASDVILNGKLVLHGLV